MSGWHHHQAVELDNTPKNEKKTLKTISDDGDETFVCLYDKFIIISIDCFDVEKKQFATPV